MIEKYIISGMLAFGFSTIPGVKGTIREDEMYYQKYDREINVFFTYEQITPGTGGTGTVWLQTPKKIKMALNKDLYLRKRTILGTAVFIYADGAWLKKAFIVPYEEDKVAFVEMKEAVYHEEKCKCECDKTKESGYMQASELALFGGAKIEIIGKFTFTPKGKK